MLFLKPTCTSPVAAICSISKMIPSSSSLARNLAPDNSEKGQQLQKYMVSEFRRKDMICKRKKRKESR